MKSKSKSLSFIDKLQIKRFKKIKENNAKSYNKLAMLIAEDIIYEFLKHRKMTSLRFFNYENCICHFEKFKCTKESKNSIYIYKFYQYTIFYEKKFLFVDFNKSLLEAELQAIFKDSEYILTNLKIEIGKDSYGEEAFLDAGCNIRLKSSNDIL